MTKSDHIQALHEVISKVLEQTAFMFPEPADLPEKATLDEYEFTCASLKFSGDEEGDLSLIVPTELCHELSANILGEEASKDNDLDRCANAAREILSIITRQFLTHLFGIGAQFNLAAPVCREISREHVSVAFTSEECAYFRIDEYPVIATFKLKTGNYAFKSSGC